MAKEPPSHEENMPRLNRAAGQIEGVKKMIAERRSCPEIIAQLRAARSALKAVESNILRAHLQHCVAQSFECGADRDEKIKELQKLFDSFYE